MSAKEVRFSVDARDQRKQSLNDVNDVRLDMSATDQASESRRPPAFAAGFNPRDALGRASWWQAAQRSR
jgi:hypothetical protein